MREEPPITIQLRPEPHPRLGTVWTWTLWSDGRQILSSRYGHRGEVGAGLAARVARARLLAGRDRAEAGDAPPPG